jgi:hypothetical protein
MINSQYGTKNEMGVAKGYRNRVSWKVTTQFSETL